MDAEYSNRELDSKFDRVHEKLDDILTRVTFTNGKVKKIIIARRQGQRASEVRVMHLPIR